jgi:molecular chaperone IbpA
MMTYDFSPLFRSAIGFDRIAKMLEDVADQSVPGYPPYNIEKLNDDAYRITLAVAGFGEDELSVETRENTLVISGSKKAEEKDLNYLHRGIATRDFVRSFRIADHVKVVDALYDNGLLHVELVRELPEAMKPRRIEVKAGKPSVFGKAKSLLGGDKDQKAAA